jgi:hypothetical protein
MGSEADRENFYILWFTNNLCRLEVVIVQIAVGDFGTHNRSTTDGTEVLGRQRKS